MKNEREGLVFEKLVNAVSLIGLTLETTEYLFEHDPEALKIVDEALESIGTPVKTLRNRSIDWHFEDLEHAVEEGYLPRLGHTFLNVTEHGIDAESVSEYITEHLDSSNGSWELVFFPDDEPEPTGENEDYTDIDDDNDDDLWIAATPSTPSISPMHMQELDYLDVHTEEEHLAELMADEHRLRLDRRSSEDRRSADRPWRVNRRDVDTCEFE
jgi:hypothetical protein